MVPIYVGDCPTCHALFWQRAWADPYGRWILIQCMVCGHVARVDTSGEG